MQMRLRVLDDKDARSWSAQPRDEDGQGVGDAKAHVPWPEPLCADARALEADRRHVRVRKPVGLHLDRPNDVTHPELDLLEQGRDPALLIGRGVPNTRPDFVPLEELQDLGGELAFRSYGEIVTSRGVGLEHISRSKALGSQIGEPVAW